MQYADYRKKMVKLANVLSVLKRFRVLIILACVLAVALLTTLLCICGIVYEVSACPQEIVYGEDLGFRAKAVMGGVTYEYSSADGGEWSKTVPVRAGSYKVRPMSKSITGKPRYGKAHAFTVLPKNIEVRAADTAVYGEFPELVADLSFADSISCTGFAYGDKYAENTDVLPDKDSIVIMNERGEDVTSSYAVTTVKTEITIGKRALTVAAGSAEKEYDGAPLTSDGYELLETTLAYGDTISYGGCKGSLTDAGEAKNQIAGEVKVYNSENVDVTDRYDLTTAYGTLTVNRRVITVNSASAEKEYDGTPLLCTDFSDDGRLVSGHILQVSAAARITDAGERENGLGFTVTGKDGKDKSGNYEIKLNAGTLTVMRRKMTVTTDSIGWTYDGRPHGFAQFSVASGFAADNEELRATQVSDITDVGSAENVCEIRAYNKSTGKETTSNYDITVLYGTLTVTAAKLTVNSQNCTWVYDGAEHSFNGYFQEGLNDIHTVTATAVSDIRDVGECANVIEVKVFAGEREVTANYDIEYFWGTLKITPRPVTVYADSAEIVYDGASHTHNAVVADNLATGHSVSGQAYGGGAVAGEYVNRVTEGTVEICDAKGKPVSSNYEITVADGVIKIIPRPITVTTADGEWIYDDEFHSDTTYKITSAAGVALVTGHSAVVESDTGIRDAGNVSNKIIIKVFAGSSDLTVNYDITYVNGTLTVKPRPITVTTASGSTVYGEPLEANEYKLTSELSPALVKDHYEEVTFTGSQVVAGTGTNDADVKILSSGGDKTANYAINQIKGTLTVSPRPITVISRDGQWTYDGMAHTRSAFDISDQKGMGLAKGQSAELSSYTSVTDVGEKKNLITVNILADGEVVTGNYDITYEYGNLSVLPRPVTVSAGSAQKGYDGAPLTCSTVSGSNIVGGHKVAAQTSGSQTDAGESANIIVGNTVIIRDASGNNVTRNYKISLAGGILKVTQREITVKPSDAQKIYDGDPLTGKLYGAAEPDQLVKGHKITAATAGSQTDAGEGVNYIVRSTVKITDSYGRDVTANYAVETASGKLTVLPRPVTVTAGSAQKEYDGTPLTCADYAVTSAYAPALVKDHKLNAEISGSQTDVGESPNVAASVRISSAAGDVTGNYAIAVVDGTLTVTGKKLTVTTADGGWVYDGGDHYVDGFGCDGLIEGHQASRKEIEAFVNAGSYENKLTVTISCGEDDVTDCYSITYVYGTVTVKKREVRVTTDGGEWVYDNTPHSNPSAKVDAGSPYGLVEGHGFTYSDAAEIVTVGEAENKITLGVAEGETDRTSNYDLHVTCGTLKVTKRPVTVTYRFDSIYFTGAPVNTVITSGYYFRSVSEYGLVDETQVTVTVLCDEYATGAATLYFEEGSAKITDYNNNDLSSNFEITLLSKQVDILKREIIIRSSDAEKIYDGHPLTCERYEIANSSYAYNIFVSDAKVEGHEAEAGITFTGSITQIGEQPNSFTVDSFKVLDGAGNDVTYGYTYVEDYGNLYVTEFGSLYVTTAGASKIYDGTPLTNNNYEVKSTLAEGYAYEIRVTGSRTEVGASYNTFDVTVFSPSGADVTAGLRLVSKLGRLVVYDREQSGVGDLDLSGGIGGGNGTVGGDGKPQTALKVYSETSGQVYMRLQSYGAYTGAGWNPANPYSGTIENKYGMNYLTGFALGGAGRQSVYMQVQVMGSYYYLPYYLASGDYGYEIQQSDVLYSGDARKIYSLYYYPYNYLQDGAVKLYLQNLTAAERGYRQFVYDNYLAVPKSTADYLEQVIAAQGFDASDSGLAAKIAAYVHSAATYNLNYDKALDKESDAVVSFLRDYKEGVCRHYASAATLLFRMMGIPARYTVGYTGMTAAGEWVEITTENAHAWVEIYVDGMGWVQIEVTGSSDGPEEEINLGIIKPADVTKEYDGKPLVANRLVEQGKLAELIKEGYTYSAQFGGSRTDVGTSSSRVTDITLFYPDGKPVKNVLWTSGEGNLTVVKAGTLITVHLYYLACEYDGQGHSLGSGDWFAEGLPAGFRMEFDPSSVAVTDAYGFDWAAIKALPLRLYNAAGYEVSGNYNIIFSCDSVHGSRGEGIDISPRNITVTTQSAEKEYDGTPLKNGEWWISFGTLASGHRMEVQVTGSLTDAGIAANRAEQYVVYDERGNDVSANYSVTYKFGTLTVID